MEKPKENGISLTKDDQKVGICQRDYKSSSALVPQQHQRQQQEVAAPPVGVHSTDGAIIDYIPLGPFISGDLRHSFYSGLV